MTSSYDRQLVDDLKRRNPLPALLERHGIAVHASAGQRRAPCPFHDDADRSLAITDDAYSCNRCEAQGDAIEFVRGIHHVGFAEALAILAEQTGQPAPPRRPRALQAPSAPRRPLRSPDHEDYLILAAAAEIYHQRLLTHQPGREYLRSRAIPDWVIDACRLGYADGHSLIPYLRRRRFSLVRAATLGLLYTHDPAEEALTGRIIVPELSRGRVTWMIGRALDDRQSPYRALSLTQPLLGFGRTDHPRSVILTKGPMDWLTLIGWGLSGSCALLGLTISQRQLNLLRRAQEIVIALGSDEPSRQAQAAIAAAADPRALPIILPPDVADLNELGQRPDGRATFLALLRSARQSRAVQSPVATTPERQDSLALDL